MNVWWAKFRRFNLKIGSHSNVFWATGKRRVNQSWQFVKIGPEHSEIIGLQVDHSNKEKKK